MQLDQEFLQKILSTEIFANSMKSILISFVLFFVLKFVFHNLITRIIKKLQDLSKYTTTNFDDYLVEILASIHPRVYDYLSFYIAVRYLNISDSLSHIFTAILIALIIFQVVSSCNNIAVYILKKVLHVEESHTGEDATVFDGLVLLIKIAIWITGALLLLANLGVNITSLATSLGIGGIAVALAIQNILSDIFSSFSIYFDKPFAIGDYIVIGTQSGTVQKIGLKTTRIKTLQGEELVIGNKELTSSQIQNFKRMERRRVAFIIGVTYDATVEKLKRVKELVAEAVKLIAGAELDRVNFFEFGDFSLNLEIVYYHPNSDYADYMAGREKLNWYLKEKFDAEGIEFAFPTQTIHLEKAAES